MIKKTFFCLAVIGSAVAASAQTAPFGQEPPHGATQQPAFKGQTRAPEAKTNVAIDVTSVARGLDHPWGLAFLPDGRMLVSERPGGLRIAAADGTISALIKGVPAADVRGQGGYLGVALDPDFATNRLIYWSFSEPRGNETNNTAVARGRLIDGPVPSVENVEVIFHQAPSLASTLHFGGRLVFAKDKTLFVTLGERSITEGRMQAQRLDGLLGKVVHIKSDGSIPKDNPFVGKAGVRPEIWSYGHRNVQAAAINPKTGKLWTIEHGTNGGDEINVPLKGHDYGWPTIAYGVEYKGGPITGNITQAPGMEQPVYYWDPVIAPSGMIFYTGSLFPAWKGSLFVGGLRTTSLVRLTLKGEKVAGEERLLTDRKKRIRDVVQGPEGAIYLLTDAGDGEILKITPAAAKR